MDTKQRQLLGEESFYVALSRAKYGAEIHTDNREILPRVLQKSLQQEAALDHVHDPEQQIGKDVQRDYAEPMDRQVEREVPTPVVWQRTY